MQDPFRLGTAVHCSEPRQKEHASLELKDTGARCSPANMADEVSSSPPDASSPPPDDPPQQSSLAHSAEVLVGALQELGDLGGEVFESPAGSDAESDYEEVQLDDGYDQLDFGSVLEGVSWKKDLKEEVSLFLRRQLEEMRARQLRLLRPPALRPRQILLKDKVAFCLGTLDLWLSAYWLGWSPQSFYKLYTAKALILFLIRWVVYRMKRWHYYLFDFCYFAQVLLLIQLWFYPASITWSKVVFAFNLGPLLWSIVAFRNSLVYHSVDKVTSHFLHWFPACVSWAGRWYPSPAMAARLAASEEARGRWESANLWELALLPMLPYCLWALLYYAKVFIISQKRIQQRGYDTLFKYATKSRRSLFGAVVLRFPQKLQPAVYMSLHMGLALVTMTFNVLWWCSKTACTAFMLGILFVSAWNGASFYFDVFAYRYVSGLGLERRRSRATPSASEQHEPSTPASGSIGTFTQHRKAK